MNIQKLTSYLSHQRFSRYLATTNNNFNRAVELYKANLQIAAAFHPLIGILEVSLRNKINQLLTFYFNDPDWIINQKTGFMAHPSLTYTDRRTGRTITNQFLRTSVEDAERRCRRLAIPVTAEKVIAEQNLSFWTDLFEVHHYRILQGRPIQIFQHLPSGIGRRDVTNDLTTIRQFRNRINHNEPICFAGQTINFNYTENVQATISNIFRWLDPDLLLWTQDVDAVTSILNTAKAI